MQTTPGTSLRDAKTAARSFASRRTTLVWLAVTGTVYLLDQATKEWATRALADGMPRPFLGEWLQFRLTFNPGAAFSLGTGYTIVLTAIALAVIVVCIKMAGRLGSRGWAVALGLLLGGALGNVTDRILRPPAPLRGHVVDFLELPNWPVFNFADVAICAAAASFVLLSLRGIRLDGSRESHDRAAVPLSDGADAQTTDDSGTA
ncbi:MAG: signal peptidase II [Nocardioidaceae bacterium]|nr:signal peptidase II [Nocardioidaceae bacterium]